MKDTDQSTNTSAVTAKRGRPREFDRAEGLRKAMRLFWKSGYETTSMADLRAELGITQASLYAAYGNKEALFREAVDLYRRTDGESTARVLAGPGTARDAVESMLRQAVEAFTQDDAPGGCLLVLGAVNCTPENLAVQESMKQFRLETVRALTKRLKRAQREGELAVTAPVPSLAEFYATVLHGLSIQARDGAPRKTQLQVIQCAMLAWDAMA